MVFAGLLSGFCLVGLGLCQQQYAHLKEQPTDPRSNINTTPSQGFGTWYLDISTKNTTDAVANAIVEGYRHIDCAPIYMNQKAVGLGIKEGMKRANIKRSDIWITSKLWGSFHDNPERGVKETLEELGLDYLDLFLLHFPYLEGSYKLDHGSAWKNMEKLVRPNSPTRYIGVANLGVTLLDEVLRNATIRPLVHQMELHPYLQQREFIKTNKAFNISVTAYAPLGNTSPGYREQFYNNKQVWGDIPPLLENDVIKKIAAKRQCKPVQVALGWSIRLGQTVIPKAARFDHQKENIGALDCSKRMTDEDDKEIAGIETRYGPRRMFNICPIHNINCYEGLTGLERWKSWIPGPLPANLPKIGSR